jgi:hypothetical protein
VGVYLPIHPGTVVALIECWITLNVMMVLALLAAKPKAARVSSLTIFALGWVAICGALRFLP